MTSAIFLPLSPASNYPSERPSSRPSYRAPLFTSSRASAAKIPRKPILPLYFQRPMFSPGLLAVTNAEMQKKKKTNALLMEKVVRTLESHCEKSIREYRIEITKWFFFQLLVDEQLIIHEEMSSVQKLR